MLRIGSDFLEDFVDRFFHFRSAVGRIDREIFSRNIILDGVQKPKKPWFFTFENF